MPADLAPSSTGAPIHVVLVGISSELVGEGDLPEAAERGEAPEGVTELEEGTTELERGEVADGGGTLAWAIDAAWLARVVTVPVVAVTVLATVDVVATALVAT